MLKSLKFRIALVLIIIAAICVTVGLVIKARAYKPIPKSIASSVNFPIYFPSKMYYSSVEKQSLSYNSSNQSLNYIVEGPSGTKITISEQATPDTFNDPNINLYPKLLVTLNQYSTIKTSIGDVALTKPKEYNGGQAAVISNGGTLMFAYPASNLTNNQWQSFLNELSVIKS